MLVKIHDDVKRIHDQIEDYVQVNVGVQYHVAIAFDSYEPMPYIKIWHSYKDEMFLLSPKRVEKDTIGIKDYVVQKLREYF